MKRFYNKRKEPTTISTTVSCDLFSKIEPSENIPPIAVWQDRFAFDLLGIMWLFFVLSFFCVVFFMIFNESILMLTQFNCKGKIFHERTQFFQVCYENRHKV